VALRTHLKIALAWLHYEEQNILYTLTTRIIYPRNPVMLTDVADYLLDSLSCHVNSDDSFEVPDGEPPSSHYFSWRLAVVTEAILELEELLDE
jgi:hypothetical protein